MAKVDDRPVDAGLATVRTKGESESVEWWKQRGQLLAGIPTDVARAGALVPMIREISHLPADERKRVVKARVQAFQQLPRDQQDRILAARKLANAIDPGLLTSDANVIAELRGEVPGVEDLLERMRA